MRKRHVLILCFMLLITVSSSWAKMIIKEPTKKHPTSFAIIVDAETYKRVGKAVDNYRDAVEKDGLSTYIVIDDWKTPDDVRTQVIALSKKQPLLEGIALVGDIPIAMIRDAQHMTSAFKMDQDNPKRFPFIESSIPSDRFYDDFDLKFQYIKKDSVNTLAHYYSLLPESPQRIEKDIYSGRIKPPVNDDSKYKRIEDYLNRIAKQKSEKNKLDNLLMFAGHGYHSESLSSWESELLTMREIFPDLYIPGGVVKNLYHTMNSELKEIVLTELQEEQLDVAIFHAHGATDTQYLLGEPVAHTSTQHIDAVKMFLRNKLREAKRRKKSLAETQVYYMENYNVPLDWFDGAFVDSVAAADSVAEYKLDIHISDIREISPQAEFIMFDECFNGAFIDTPYVAGEYVFGKGTVVAGVANSVNVLQDIWADEFLGLLGYGVRLGNWHKTRNFLESHIIGDPTFHYTNNSDLDLNNKLIFAATDVKFWQGLLKNDQPVLRMLAVHELYTNMGDKFEKDLVKIYKTDPAFNVRLIALKYLAELRTREFENILKISVNDPAELIRRFSVNWMGDVGKEEYLPFLAERFVMDHSDRINFKSKGAIEKISPSKGNLACDMYINSMPAVASKDKLKKTIGVSFEHTVEWLNDLLKTVENDTFKLKKRISNVRTFRNYRFQEALPTLLSVAKDANQNSDLRVHLIEALGWFNCAYNRSDIIKTCDEILKQKDLPDPIKAEAIKTKNRIIEGANNSLTP